MPAGRTSRAGRAAGPAGPCGPEPAAPAGPWPPCAPAGPAGPWAPCAPAGPAGPLGPLMLHEIFFAPFKQTKKFRSPDVALLPFVGGSTHAVMTPLWTPGGCGCCWLQRSRQPRRTRPLQRPPAALSMLTSAFRAPSVSSPGADGPLLGSASAKLVRRSPKSNASPRSTAIDALVGKRPPNPPAAASPSCRSDHPTMPPHWLVRVPNHRASGSASSAFAPAVGRSAGAARGGPSAGARRGRRARRSRVARAARPTARSCVLLEPGELDAGVEDGGHALAEPVVPLVRGRRFEDGVAVELGAVRRAGQVAVESVGDGRLQPLR